jgi:hypothetical protein
MTLSITGLIATLSTTPPYHHAECHYAEYHYAKCHYAE